MPTPPFVPLPQMGQHLTAATIKPLIVGTDGSLTAGTAVSIYAQRRSMEVNIGVQRSEVNHASARRLNEVVEADGCTMNMEIFLVNNGSDPNPLTPLAAAGDYFLVEWVTGTRVGSIESHKFYGVRGDLSFNNAGRGEHIASWALGPCDTGQAQYTRTLS